MTGVRRALGGEWGLARHAGERKVPRGSGFGARGGPASEDTRTKLTHICVLSGCVCLDIGLVGVEEFYHLQTNHSRQALYSHKLS